LETIEILQETTPYIIHFNINEETVLYDEKNAIPVLSDFRMGLIESDLENEYEYLVPEYDENQYWPFEIYMLTHTSQEVESFMESHRIKPKEEVLNEYIERLENKPREEQLEIIKKAAKTWDIYAITILFLRQLEEEDEYKKYLYDEINKLPEEREDAKEQKARITEIFMK
jgi:hypothetical protein